MVAGISIEAAQMSISVSRSSNLPVEANLAQVVLPSIPHLKNTQVLTSVTQGRSCNGAGARSPFTFHLSQIVKVGNMSGDVQVGKSLCAAGSHFASARPLLAIVLSKNTHSFSRILVPIHCTYQGDTREA